MGGDAPEPLGRDPRRRRGLGAGPGYRAGALRHITKTGDQFGGTTLEELTAKCMAGCAWHLTGKTWPASAPPNEVTYSAQVHGDPVASAVLASYAVNGSPQYWPDFLAITP